MNPRAIGSEEEQKTVRGTVFPTNLMSSAQTWLERDAGQAPSSLALGGALQSGGHIRAESALPYGHLYPRRLKPTALLMSRKVSRTRCANFFFLGLRSVSEILR